jgi:tetratricopeptide (TPR) repeat protein
MLAVAMVSALLVGPGFAVNPSRARLSQHLEHVGDHVFRTYYDGAGFIISAGQTLETDPVRASERRRKCLSELSPWPQGRDPEYAYLLSLEAEHQLRIGNRRRANELADRALHYNPDEINRLRSCQIYTAVGEFSKARVQVDSVLAENPAHVMALKFALDIGILEKDAAACTRNMDQALRVAPEDPELRRYLKLLKATGLYRASASDSSGPSSHR